MWENQHEKGLSTLGLLIGMTEALAIVHWEVLMDDFSIGQLGAALGWGAAIMGVTTLFWTGLERLCRRRLWVATTIYLAAVLVARAWVDDRFFSASLFVVPVALFLAWRQPRGTRGLLAVLLAMPALWGRVPNYAASVAEHFAILLPAILPVVGLGVFRHRRAVWWGAPAGAMIVLGLITGIGWVRQSAPACPNSPNLLFVLVDTLRRDHVQPYAETVTTPSFERISREGVRFDDAITVIPKTTQSVASFFTGRYPVSHGVRVLKGRLGADQRTLAEVLRDAGYETAAFVHNGWVMRGKGFEQGFGQFWSWYEIERPFGLLTHTGFVTAIDGLTLHRAKKFDPNTDARLATDRALSWLESTHHRPFFAYVHYFDPHWPYRPPGQDGECLVNNVSQAGIPRGRMIFQNDLPEEENRRARELYRGEVQHNTDQINRLLDWLSEAELDENTIVVFTADHGHHLGDHNYYYHHGELLYEPGVRIPLAMRWAGQLPAGRVVGHQVRSIDVMPTLLALMGISSPAVDGEPMLEAVPDPAFLETDISYFKENTRRYVKGVIGKVRGVRTGDWKLIYSPRKTGGRWELYDLQRDREELHDLIREGSADPMVIGELMKTLARWIPAAEQKRLAKFGDRFDCVEIQRHEGVGKLLPCEAPPEDTPGGAEPIVDEASPAEVMTKQERDMLRELGYIQ